MNHPNLTPMTRPEIHQYKTSVYARKPFRQTAWNEVDRINAEINERDTNPKESTHV